MFDLIVCAFILTLIFEYFISFMLFVSHAKYVGPGGNYNP